MFDYEPIPVTVTRKIKVRYRRVGRIKPLPYLLAAILALLLLASADASDRYSKAKGRGAWAFAVAKSQCACGDSCPCAQPAQPAAKPEPTTVEAPAQSGTIVSGSCSSGSCGTSTTYSSGLFRRRR